MVNAIRKDDRVLCGKCLNRLFDIKTLDGNITIVILCKARKNGINCNELNYVELVTEKQVKT